MITYKTAVANILNQHADGYLQKCVERILDECVKSKEISRALHERCNELREEMKSAYSLSNEILERYNNLLEKQERVCECGDLRQDRYFDEYDVAMCLTCGNKIVVKE
jgi:hypothetical protein